MIKAVIAGTSHMHVNKVALYISEHPNYELIGIADVPSNIEQIPSYRYTPLWNMENVKKNYCSVIYNDYKKMLDELCPNIAFVLTEIAQKRFVEESSIRVQISRLLHKFNKSSMKELTKELNSLDFFNIIN